MEPAKPLLRRCAIYTRKSSEEGLEQNFNSLHAQREACEAFIKSQASEGWRLVKTHYDDGGLSGASLERPALQQLLGDIRQGLVETVVVYKVARLTRSLADFAKLVELFDAHQVSFVAVTQQFNTTTSMGRLTLNVLLSFAQFEREVTGERIRDKIAASRRKGLWMGGVVPLGYDLRERRLVVNPAEAEVVRQIFRRYLELGCVRLLKDELDRRGAVSKLRSSGNGARPRGYPFSRGALYVVLSNPLYIGEVRHRGVRHPGQHQPIVERELWEKVQQQLHEHARRWLRAVKVEPSPLTGKLFDPSGAGLTPSHARKGERRYRYYISRGLNIGPVYRDHDGWRLPAPELERTVAAAAQQLLTDELADFSASTEGAIVKEGARIDAFGKVYAPRVGRYDRSVAAVRAKETRKTRANGGELRAVYARSREVAARGNRPRMSWISHHLELTFYEDGCLCDTPPIRQRKTDRRMRKLEVPGCKYLRPRHRQSVRRFRRVREGGPMAPDLPRGDQRRQVALLCDSSGSGG